MDLVSYYSLRGLAWICQQDWENGCRHKCLRGPSVFDRWRVFKYCVPNGSASRIWHFIFQGKPKYRTAIHGTSNASVKDNISLHALYKCNRRWIKLNCVVCVGDKIGYKGGHNINCCHNLDIKIPNFFPSSSVGSQLLFNLIRKKRLLKQLMMRNDLMKNVFFELRIWKLQMKYGPL